MRHDSISTFPSDVHRLLGASVHPALEPTLLQTIGFSKHDLLWSVALWLATLGLAPFVIFYVLMVN